MFKTLGNAWKVADIRKKILYTLFILLIHRLGIVIPAPGVNVAYIGEQVNNYTAPAFSTCSQAAAWRACPSLRLESLPTSTLPSS